MAKTTETSEGLQARHWWYVGLNLAGLVFCAASGFTAIYGERSMAALKLCIAVAFFVAARRQLRGLPGA